MLKLNHKIVNNNNDGCGTADQLDEARSYLKGCYMDWMQSVNRIVRNHAVIPVEQANDFLNLVYSLRVNEYKLNFDNCVSELSKNFQIAADGLHWWLQPSIKSMIFRCGSLMKLSSREHVSRTSNSVEAYHNMLYTTIVIILEANFPSVKI